MNKRRLETFFQNNSIEVVCNLAAQAGVRHSIENPSAYISSNISGFFNILECCRHFHVKHLVYASSSSVYGESLELPFSTKANVDRPVSLYAATKKSNELMAHSYSHLFGFISTGLRFFTVYGPWGRPDMAYYLFTDAISNEREIEVFNNGEMERDFTYIDDIIEGVTRVINSKVTNRKLYNVFNIGNNKPVKLIEFIKLIENCVGKNALIKKSNMQKGDVTRTFADIDPLIKEYGFRPHTNLNEGLQKFVDWYNSYK